MITAPPFFLDEVKALAMMDFMFFSLLTLSRKNLGQRRVLNLMRYFFAMDWLLVFESENRGRDCLLPIRPASWGSLFQ